MTVADYARTIGLPLVGTNGVRWHGTRIVDRRGRPLERALVAQYQGGPWEVALWTPPNGWEVHARGTVEELRVLLPPLAEAALDAGTGWAVFERMT